MADSRNEDGEGEGGGGGAEEEEEIKTETITTKDEASQTSPYLSESDSSERGGHDQTRNNDQKGKNHHLMKQYRITFQMAYEREFMRFIREKPCSSLEFVKIFLKSYNKNLAVNFLVLALDRAYIHRTMLLEKMKNTRFPLYELSSKET